MKQVVTILVILVLAGQFSLMRWEMLTLQRRGRPMWLAVVPIVSLLVIAYDAIAGRLRSR